MLRFVVILTPLVLVQMRMFELECFESLHLDVLELHSQIVELEVNETKEDWL